MFILLKVCDFVTYPLVTSSYLCYTLIDRLTLSPITEVVLLTDTVILKQSSETNIEATKQTQDINIVKLGLNSETSLSGFIPFK